MISADVTSKQSYAPCLNEKAEECATDLGDTECECGTITPLKNILATYEGAKTNTADILGYVDPGGEAECASNTADGASSSADVPEGLTLQMKHAPCKVPEQKPKLTAATNKTDKFGVCAVEAEDEASEPPTESDVMDEQSDPLAAHVNGCDGTVKHLTDDDSDNSELSPKITTKHRLRLKGDVEGLSQPTAMMPDHDDHAGKTVTGCTACGKTYLNQNAAAIDGEGQCKVKTGCAHIHEGPK